MFKKIPLVLKADAISAKHVLLATPRDAMSISIQNLPISTANSIQKKLSALLSEYGNIVNISITRPSRQENLSPIDLLEEDDEKVGDLIVPGCIATVEFDDPSASESFFNADITPRKWTEIRFGLVKWKKQYAERRTEDVKEYQAEIDERMRLFDEREAEKLAALKAIHNKPDEDGWVTVVRGVNRRNTSNNQGVVVAAANPKDLRNLKPKSHEKSDFYAFQRAEFKKQRYYEMKERMEREKKKVQLMTKNRKFKPY